MTSARWCRLTGLRSIALVGALGALGALGVLVSALDLPWRSSFVGLDGQVLGSRLLDIGLPYVVLEGSFAGLVVVGSVLA